jgi:hypothetical protein
MRKRMSTVAWGNNINEKISFFHMNARGRRVNGNIFYSPGVDRCFAVDTFDPYTAFECAKILSSKMPAIAVLVIGKDEKVDVHNGNITNFTVNDKQIIGGSAGLLFSRQTPVFRKMKDPFLVPCLQMPKDYVPGTQGYDTFIEFSEYAKFVIRTWHTAKIFEMVHNFLPMEEFVNDFLSGEVDTSMSTPADSSNTVSSLGPKNEIRRILYNADTVDDAMNKIADMWRENNTPHSYPMRKMFYAILNNPDYPEPADLAKQTSQADTDLSGYSGYLL